MAKSSDRYKATEEEIRTLIKLEEMFNFPVDATIFSIGNTPPIVVAQSYLEDYPERLRKFAKKTFQDKWYYSTWGFYVNYEDLEKLINENS